MLADKINPYKMAYRRIKGKNHRKLTVTKSKGWPDSFWELCRHRISTRIRKTSSRFFTGRGKKIV